MNFLTAVKWSVLNIEASFVLEIDENRQVTCGNKIFKSIGKYDKIKC